VVEVGTSLLDAALEVDEVSAAVRGAEHSQAPSTIRHPMDSVGRGPRDALDDVTDGPN
jgi:hypothetical protein